jgi:hypothetical protein
MQVGRRRVNAPALTQELEVPMHDQDTRARFIAEGGAICERCDRRMLIAEGCTGEMIETPHGAYPPIAYGDEAWVFLNDPYPSERCHDCGCLPGHYHHQRCDVAECPACGGQYLAHEHGEPCIAEVE